MASLDFDKALSFCWFSNILCIKEEIEKYLEGYSLQSIEKHKIEYDCYFNDENDNSITMTIQRDRIGLYIFMNNSVDRILIDENLVLTCKSVVRRQNGVLYSIIKKQFSLSEYFSDKVDLVDINEKRFVFKNETIASLLNKSESTDFRLEKLLLNLMLTGYKIDLSKKADYFSDYTATLECEMNQEMELKFDYFTVKVNVDGKDVSYLYKNLKGNDIISRVYNLYIGRINFEDADAVRNSFLTLEATNLKLYSGITKKEDEILGDFCFDDSEMQLNVTSKKKRPTFM